MGGCPKARDFSCFGGRRSQSPFHLCEVVR